MNSLLKTLAAMAGIFFAVFFIGKLMIFAKEIGFYSWLHRLMERLFF